MRNATKEMFYAHLCLLKRIENGEIPMHISWKLVEVGQGFLSGYKEVYLATQLLQEPPTALACLEFARELHECLAKAFKADPESMVFVLSTVSVTRKPNDPGVPLFEMDGKVPPAERPAKWDSDVEINLGPEPPQK